MIKTVMLLFFVLSIGETFFLHRLHFQINSKESLIALQVVLEFKPKNVIANVSNGNETLIAFERETIRGDLQVAYYVARWLSSISNDVNLFSDNHQEVEAIDQWVGFAINDLSNPKKFNSSMQELDSALNSKNLDKLTYADIAVWAELKRSNDWQKSLEYNETTFNNLRSWHEFLSGMPQF